MTRRIARAALISAVRGKFVKADSVRSALLISFFAASLPTSALSADVGGSLSFGKVGEEGGYARMADASARFQLGGAADLTARLDFGVTSDLSGDAGYASAGLGTRFGSIDFGRPRSILEVGPLPDPARFSASTTRGTFRPLAAEIALEQGLGSGFRVQAETGGLQIGTSYHNVDETEDGVFGVAGRYDLAMGESVDAVTLYGGVESDGTIERYRLGTEVTLGRAVASVDLLRTGDDGSAASQVSLGMAVTDALTLGVTGLRETEDSLSDPVSRLGIGATMSLETGTFLRGGFDTRTSDDYAIDLEIGFQF